jgi:hypothetical protein
VAVHRHFEFLHERKIFADHVFQFALRERKESSPGKRSGSGILHDGRRFAIPLWWVFQDQAGAFGLRNGTAILIELGQGVIAVTAAHVFREYCENRWTAQAIGCQLGNALFDPESYLIDCNDDLDIATFRISPEMVGQIDKPVVPADAPNWAPLNPMEREFAFFAGFPAQSRGMTPTGRMFVAVPYFAMPPITRVTDRQIACRFERDKMIDFKR